MLNLDKIYKSSRFYFGNCWRYFSQPWLQEVIEPKQASTIFGCNFGDQGWNHIRKTLEEYDKNQSINYKHTTLYKYLKEFKPTSMNLLDPEKVSPCHLHLPLFVHPWGTFKKGETKTKKNPSLSRFCGPSSDNFIQQEFSRIIALYKKIKETGYQPWKQGNSFIGGTFLIRRNGEKKFIVLQGNHRMAILSHLGFKKIAVRNVPGYITRVKENELKGCLLVKDKLCSEKQAQKHFEMFFHLDGSHIQSLMGIEV